MAGAWAEWGPWEPCSVSCGGGHQSRQRSCVDPPPKNGGAPCPGPSHEKVLCNLQLCPGDTGKGKLAGRDLRQWSPRVCLRTFWCPPSLSSSPSDCEPGRVHVNAELCQKGLVPPCPPSCLDPEANRSCSGHCMEGEAEPERGRKRSPPKLSTVPKGPFPAPRMPLSSWALPPGLSLSAPL